MHLNKLFGLFSERECVDLLKLVFAFDAFFEFDLSLLDLNEMELLEGGHGRVVFLVGLALGFSEQQESSQKVRVLELWVSDGVTQVEDARDVIRCFGVACLKQHGPCGQFENRNSVLVVQKRCFVIPDGHIEDGSVFQLARSLKRDL